MIANYCCSGDWAFYLESDEVPVLHGNDLPTIPRERRHYWMMRIEKLL